MRASVLRSFAVTLVVVLLGATPASSQPVSLVTVGDSLTAGDGDSGAGGGYPARLLSMLQADHPGSTLLNLAVSGQTSDDLRNVQLSPAVAALQDAPSGNRRLGLVWIGSNDLFGLYNYVCDSEYGNDYNACERDTFGYFSENIDAILSALTATGAEIYIAILDDQSRRPVMTDSELRSSIYDQISDQDVTRMSTQVSRYNDEIVQQAGNHGATTVDFFHTTIFEDWDTLDSDGNHPNGAGYDAITAIWYQAVAGTSSGTHQLTVTTSGSGSGTVTSDPSGISCGSDCIHDYEEGTTVTLAATPGAGSVFAGWGGACSGTGDCVITMSTGRSVRATFNTASGFEHAYLVPVAVHSPGDDGTNWRSNLVCLNDSGNDASLNLVLLSTSGSWEESVSVSAGTSREWQDIVVTLFGRPTSASTAGALHITADQPLRITSRTYNQGATGTFGQYLPALGAADALTGSHRGYLLNLKGIGFRTNVGLVNLGTASCQLRLILYDADGTAIGTAKTVTVPAGEWVQKNDVFDFVRASPQSLAYATLELVSGTGSFWAYASVIDADTGDATTIPVL